MSLRRSATLRFLRIVFLVVKFVGTFLLSRLLAAVGLGERVGGRHPLLGGLAGPARVRLFLQEVDGALIKIGQILAMRVDFLPPHYVQELLKLLDEVPPFDSGKAREIIEAELEGKIDELFTEFEDEPLASASFAQVHAARLANGDEVVVKVQRPTVPDTIAADLRLFKVITTLVDATGLTQRTPVRKVFDEFAEWTREELDLRIEGSHIEEIARKAESAATQKIPKVHWRLTSQRVLTLERLKGIWVKEVMQQIDSDPEGVARRLRKSGTSLQQVAENLLRNTLTQIFEYGVYHSDPHAGNLLLMRDGRVGYVDFGITGRIGKTSRQQQVDIHIALESGDFERFFNAILATIEDPYFADLAKFRRKVEKCYKVWLRAQYMEARNTREKSFARLMLALNDAAQKTGIGFKSMEVRIFRTLATVDAILLDFAPNLDVRAEFRRFFTHYNLKTLAHEDVPLAVQRLPAAIRHQLSLHLDHEVPRLVARISRLRRVFSGVLKLAALVLALAGVGLAFGVDLLVTQLERLDLGRGAGVAACLLVGLFCLWLGHRFHLGSIVRDRVILPAEERLARAPVEER